MIEYEVESETARAFSGNPVAVRVRIVEVTATQCDQGELHYARRVVHSYLYQPGTEAP